MKRKNVMVACLLALTLVVFWQVSGHDFIIFDDPDYVVNNLYVSTGLSLENIRWAFTSYTVNWHPLTWISHMVDVQLFGLAPRHHHLVNLILHIANTFLLFFVLDQMTKAFGRSLCVAALFALHPLHVESVAWVAERKDLLSTLFGLLTVIAYVNYARESCRWRYLLMCLFFVCSLLSKPMLVSLPLILLLFDFWPLARFDKLHVDKIRVAKIRSVLLSRIVLEKLPLLLLAGCSSIITVIAQRAGGAVSSLESVSISLRLANAIVAYQKYVQKMVYPVGLSILYPMPKYIDYGEVVIALILFAAICVTVFYIRCQYPYLLVGWFFFVISLIPVIGIVHVGSQAMADRYTYLPFTGLFIMMIWGSVDLTVQWKRQKLILVIVATIVGSLVTITTWKRIGEWKNSITIFSQAASVVGSFYIVQNQLGVAFSEASELEKAVYHLRLAILDKPDFATSYYNLGNVLVKTGQITQAIESYSNAVLYDPAFIDAYFNRAILYTRLGSNQQALSDLLNVVNTGFRLSNKNHCTAAETFFLLGKTQAGLGDMSAAIRSITQSITMNSDNSSAYFSRGLVNKTIGNLTEAKNDFSYACKKGNIQGCQQLETMGGNLDQ